MGPAVSRRESGLVTWIRTGNARSYISAGLGTHTRTDTRAHTHTGTHANTHAHRRSHTGVHAHTHTHTRTHLDGRSARAMGTVLPRCMDYMPLGFYVVTGGYARFRRNSLVITWKLGRWAKRSSTWWAWEFNSELALLFDLFPNPEHQN